jgi:hypothetical protein
MEEGLRLSDAVVGMRALTRAYNSSEMMVLALRIKQGWLFLDRLWGAEVQCNVAPSLRWELLNLWEETQRVVRARLNSEFAPEVDWGRWESRFMRLRQELGR